jgi:hypothetical protein
MGESSADIATGKFILAGDTPTVLASGTFTADFVVNTIATSAIGGVNAWKDAFIEITSGNLSGAILLLTANTANSVTVANKKARATAALPVVNGDTFRIWKPTTEVSAPAVTATTYPGIYDWSGGGGPSSLATSPLGNAVCHFLYRLRFTGNISYLSRSVVCFLACRQENTALYNQNSVQCGVLSNGSAFGTANTNNDRLWGAGLVTSSTLILGNTALGGVWSPMSTVSMASTGGNTIYHAGGRIDGGGAGAFGIDAGSFYNLVDNGNAWLALASQFNMLGNSVSTFAGPGVCTVAAGSCLRASRGAEARFISNFTMTGGTTDPAGFGTDGLNGGRFYYSNLAPVLTGGTANQDVRLNTIVKANAFFAAAGDAIAEPAFGSFVARISGS